MTCNCGCTDCPKDCGCIDCRINRGMIDTLSKFDASADAAKALLAHHEDGHLSRFRNSEYDHD